MSWSLRRVLVVLTAVAACGTIACLQTAFAQQPGRVVRGPIIINPGMPVQPLTGSADAASFDLPRDTDARRHIEAAREYIDAKRWPEVVKAIQLVLDDDQDKFAPLVRKGPDGKEVEVPTSVRAEANRLLAGLPADGLAAYKTTVGPAAVALLGAAASDEISERRLAELGTVVSRYLHTDAGAEAADLLATHFMDESDFRTAARYYALLLTRAGGADALEPEVLFRAAYAFRQTGDKAHEDVVWQSVRGRGIREIKFGEDARPVSDLQEYLASVAPPADVAGQQWNYYLGDAAHTGRGDGGPAFMWRKWSEPTTNSYLNYPVTGVASGAEKEFATKLTALFSKAADAVPPVNQPVLPPQFPVAAAVTFKKDGTRHSVVVCRSHAGIGEVDMANGKIVGYSPIDGSLEWMMDGSRQSALSTFEQQYIGQQNGQPGQRPGIFFENTTVGTLSIDGDFAYTVADLTVPKPPNYRTNMGFAPGMPQNQFGWSKDVMDMISHDRLAAYDLSRGCTMVWDSRYFDADNKEGIPDLSGCFFLGPPLAVNGKLYVLSEKQQELRLICLENVKGEGDAWKPKVDFVLSLGVSRDSKLEDDALRRVNAAHLSYGEGVLVCPTNLGYVIGIDLLQNSLLWAYPYRDKADAGLTGLPPGVIRVLPGGIMIGAMTGQQIQPTLPQQGWRGGAPIIQDGKVVFTACDSKSIHCVNLRDGSPLWTRPRQENDLYVGGVVNGKVIVVGQKVVRAYNLSNGQKPWEAVETGMPTGFGAASDNVYYVPLKGFAGGKEPEICAIDVDRGVIVGHSKAHVPPGHEGEKPEEPGNLVFFDGAIISQNNQAVTAYPQIKVKVAEMTAALTANPNDLDGLKMRGELNLEKGDMEAAVQDFRTVLGMNPPENLQKAVQEKLYYALTDLFQRHFDQAEKYQDEYAALCSAAPANAPPGDKAAALRRRTKYLCLLAEGKEGQHRLAEAFDLYMQLNAEAPPDLPLPLVDEPMVKAAPDVLAQGRIAAMVANASEEERRPLEARIAARWREIQARNDPAELRKFVAMFGSLFTVGQEARLQLAEQLMEDDKDENSLIDAERQLSLLRARSQDPELSARAVECLARLNTRKGLLEDAAYYYRVLRDRYPNIKVKDGKTGADLFNEMATDKRLWAHLDDPPRLGAGGHLIAKEERGNYGQQPAYHFSHDGEPLPFFQQNSLTLQFNENALHMTDRTTGEARWKPISAGVTMFALLLQPGFNNVNPNQPIFVAPGMMQANPEPQPTPRFSYMTLGHLAVVPVGNIVVGIDAATGRELWRRNLLDRVDGPPAADGVEQPPSVTVDPRDGSMQIVYQEGWTQHLGRISPLEGAAVCLQMRDGLVAIDPISGRVLWTRTDVFASSVLFGDDQHVFVVDMGDNGKAASTRVFRTYDGATVAALDFHQLFEDRVRLVGRDILTADKDKDATVLRLYDPLTGKDVWKQAFAPKSFVLQGEECDLGGVIEPDGQVRVVDLAAGKEVLTPKTKIEAKYLDKDSTYTLLADPLDVYVVPNAPPGPASQFSTNLMPNTGLRGMNVNGEIYAFEPQPRRGPLPLAPDGGGHAAGAGPLFGDADDRADRPDDPAQPVPPADQPAANVADDDRQGERQAAEGSHAVPGRKGSAARDLPRRPVLQPGGERPRRPDRTHRPGGQDQHWAGERPAGEAVTRLAGGRREPADGPIHQPAHAGRSPLAHRRPTCLNNPTAPPRGAPPRPPPAVQPSRLRRDVRKPGLDRQQTCGASRPGSRVPQVEPTTCKLPINRASARAA